MKHTKKEFYNLIKNDPTMFYRPMPAEFKPLFPVITLEVLENMGLHFTTKHTGKMSGMISLSTSCKCSELCMDRIAAGFKAMGIDTDITTKEDARAAFKELIEKDPLRTDILICVFCFSDILQDRQATMQIPLKRNFDILNNGIIHDDYIPVLNCLYLRGESFGDYSSAYAAINIFKVAAKNPAVNVTPWTKNLRFFHEAVKMGYSKPENLHLIYSSFFINKVATIPAAYEYLVDAVFTVYTEAYASANNIEINCGARSCLACLRCYRNYSGVKYVNELLK